jgi:hypothetical protein
LLSRASELLSCAKGRQRNSDGNGRTVNWAAKSDASGSLSKIPAKSRMVEMEATTRIELV